MYDSGLLNGWVVGDEIRKANIYVQDGRIAEVTPEVRPARTARDVTGLYVLPGCIDPHCHFRDPGAEDKEDFRTGTQAAAAGGVTTVLDMPNTNPPVMKGEDVTRKLSYFRPKAYVDYGVWGLSLGDINLGQLSAMKKAGAAAIKFFWGYAINKRNYSLVYNYTEGQHDIIPPLDDGEVYAIFRQIAANHQILAIHAENSELIHRLTKEVMQTGRRDYRALLDSRPALAEVLTVGTAIAMAAHTGARLHVLHVTSKEGVELIRQAKAKGLPVTAETCPQYLFLSADDYERLGPVMKVYPPVKEKEDQQALWQGLLDGTIDFVASDHAPHRIEEKQGDLFQIPSGMCGVESMLPLLLGEVSRGRITLPFVTRVLAGHTAAIYQMKHKGVIAPGYDADLVLVDMQREKAIRNEDLHSKQPLTAFAGKWIKGWPVSTYLRGRRIVENGRILGEPSGRPIAYTWAD